MSDHAVIIGTAKEVIALAGVAGVCERKLAQTVIGLAAENETLRWLVDEYQAGCECDITDRCHLCRKALTALPQSPPPAAD